MVFWVTPGINADHMRFSGGRVCRTNTRSASIYAPLSDNSQFMGQKNLISLSQIRELPADFPKRGTFVGLKSE
jgi:hypothetical protein